MVISIGLKEEGPFQRNKGAQVVVAAAAKGPTRS
jgi:hypothetical protein